MTRFIVVLGTCSHSGKSTIVAALCRILRNRGLKVAPFKSQNMSLNSWVTSEGKEMGIAQAVQAWAAGVEPSELMNPILLKPKGDRTSQVIVFGVPVADRSAEEYYREIDGLKGVVDQAIDELSRDYDYIVVEGAGGAAEINLFDRDIANIYVARKLGAPIILVGDIERGGVFASLYGTAALLPPEIRPLVKGLVINKFRGDPAILEPGLGMLEELTGVPVLGVMPYLDLDLPSEDSVSLGDKRGGVGGEKVEIAVVRLPRISNFTDFEPLEREARVRYVAPGEPLGSPDAVIIPGTKNTVADLEEMRVRGTDREILALRRGRGPDPRDLRRLPDPGEEDRRPRDRERHRRDARPRPPGPRDPVRPVREEDRPGGEAGHRRRPDPGADWWGEGVGLRDPHGSDRLQGPPGLRGRRRRGRRRPCHRNLPPRDLQQPELQGRLLGLPLFEEEPGPGIRPPG